jgi:hypothetical protein
VIPHLFNLSDQGGDEVPDNRIHYEVFGRRRPKTPWTLEMATEEGVAALTRAEDLIQIDELKA